MGLGRWMGGELKVAPPKFVVDSFQKTMLGSLNSNMKANMLKIERQCCTFQYVFTLPLNRCHMSLFETRVYLTSTRLLFDKLGSCVSTLFYVIV